MHDNVKDICNLPATFDFPYDSCKKRINRGLFNSATGSGKNKSPLHDIEQHIITLLIAIADSGNPLTVGNALPGINSLIQGTQHRQNLIEWNRNICYTLTMKEKN